MVFILFTNNKHFLILNEKKIRCIPLAEYQQSLLSEEIPEMCHSFKSTKKDFNAVNEFIYNEFILNGKTVVLTVKPNASISEVSGLAEGASKYETELQA